MELKVVPHDKNLSPLKGLLIKSSSTAQWLKEIQTNKLAPSHFRLFPIPDLLPNSVWGCILLFEKPIPHEQTGRHQLCQAVSPTLFIPERSTLYPTVTPAELDTLLASGIFVFHPDFGWVELSAELKLSDLIDAPTLQPLLVTKPASSIFVPKNVWSFQVQALPAEDVIKDLEENILPRFNKPQHEPLTLLEKIRLGIYRTFFSNTSAANVHENDVQTSTGKQSFFDRLFKSRKSKIEDDFKDLEERNKKDIDRLMDMLKKDPNKALHYAIPLDESGSTRGGPKGRVGISKRWMDFSIFGNARGSTGSGSIDLGDQYYDLQRQYNTMAENLVAGRDYKKAAFVYLKLLKNHLKAAETLEAGKHFQEAASIYLKYLNNKAKAAECYEKGLMTKEAISLYKELNENEKVGDLYMTLSDRSNAFTFYKKVIDEYATRGQFVKASLVGKNKMGDPTLCQSLLFEGWKTQRDPVNCLNNYFANITDDTQLYDEIKSIYNTEVSDLNRENFLDVLTHEFRKKNALREPLKEMAHEIIAIQLEKNRSIVTQLKNFDPENAELMKDTLRFKLNRQNRM